MIMTSEMYDYVHKELFGDDHRNTLIQILTDRGAIRGSIQGTPEEFSQILYEMTRGELNRRNELVSYEAIAKTNKNILKFSDGSLFRVVKAKGRISGVVIVVTPHLPSMEDLLEARDTPLSRLVSDALMIRDAYDRVVDEYQRIGQKLASERAAADREVTRQSRLESVVATIEKARSGAKIMVRGQQNIDELVSLGFIHGFVDNPDSWIDAEEFPGLRYRHNRSGIEVILIGRERFRPIEELNRLEFTFLVVRSDDDPKAFGTMARKFRETRGDGTPYSMKEFHRNLIALVKYPEELKGRTEEDLGLMADEVEHVIDRRQELDKGILPYEAIFRKDTATIIEFIRKNKTPAREIRKALDYFEYTGMITPHYKETLHNQITAAISGPPSAAPAPDDLLYDKRVKEIVADVLRKIPKKKLTSSSITIALTPYVNELGFGRLVKIRERILQLKEMVRDQ